jgi:GntR family transcriptional regulator
MKEHAAYQVLARDLRDAILRHEFADGTRLPTEAELSERYGVSRQTVRRAFHDLVSEGMVQRVPGRGTFAATQAGQYLRQFGSIDDLMALSIDTSLEIIHPLRRRSDLSAADRLGLESSTVYTLVFLRLRESTPFCVTTVHLRPEAGVTLEGLAELASVGATSKHTIIRLLDTRLPNPISEAEQSLTAAGADDEVAERLGCAPGSPVLRADRIYLTSDGVPVELAVSYFLPDQYTYRVKLCRSS